MMREVVRGKQPRARHEGRVSFCAGALARRRAGCACVSAHVPNRDLRAIAGRATRAALTALRAADRARAATVSGVGRGRVFRVQGCGVDRQRKGEPCSLLSGSGLQERGRAVTRQQHDVSSPQHARNPQSRQLTSRFGSSAPIGSSSRCRRRSSPGGSSRRLAAAARGSLVREVSEAAVVRCRMRYARMHRGAPDGKLPRGWSERKLSQTARHTARTHARAHACAVTNAHIGSPSTRRLAGSRCCRRRRLRAPGAVAHGQVAAGRAGAHPCSARVASPRQRGPSQNRCSAPPDRGTTGTQGLRRAHPRGSTGRRRSESPPGLRGE